LAVAHRGLSTRFSRAGTAISRCSTFPRRRCKLPRQRLGPAAGQLNWLVADLLTWRPERTYRIWHDRAVLHFLTNHDARQRYLRRLLDIVETGGTAVIATFAPDGTDHCSGLPVACYSPAELAAVVGSRWRPIAEVREEHTTPGDTVQPFTWTAFRRL
jgi:hypothetical protein